MKPNTESEIINETYDNALAHIKAGIASAKKRQQDELDRQEKNRVDYYQRMLKHIENCGMGFIDAKPYPLGMLIYELEQKVVIDDEWAEFKDPAIQLKAEILKKLYNAQEKQAEESKAKAKESEEKAKQDALDLAKQQAEEAKQREIADAKKRESNKQHHAKINNEAVAALIENCPSCDDVLAKEIVTAIAKGLINNVSIRY